MTKFVISKETVKPASFDANTMYIVVPPSAPADYLEIYVSDNTGTALRHIPTKADIEGWISQATNKQAMHIVDTISDRDGLNPTSLTTAYVKDASADSTVSSGGAWYIYDTNSSAWIKTAEAESMDVVMSWANIQGKPTSSVTKIDKAVRDSHTHANKTQLDKINEDNGELTYDGKPVATHWAKTDW